jgi:hypothetical protein
VHASQSGIPCPSTHEASDQRHRSCPSREGDGPVTLPAVPLICALSPAQALFPIWEATLDYQDQLHLLALDFPAVWMGCVEWPPRS